MEWNGMQPKPNQLTSFVALPLFFIRVAGFARTEDVVRNTAPTSIIARAKTPKTSPQRVVDSFESLDSLRPVVVVVFPFE